MKGILTYFGRWGAAIDIHWMGHLCRTMVDASRTHVLRLSMLYLRQCTSQAISPVNPNKVPGLGVGLTLALGVDLCLIGRPALWSLEYGGQAGVELVLDILENESRLTMLSWC